MRSLNAFIIVYWTILLIIRQNNIKIYRKSQDLRTDPVDEIDVTLKFGMVCFP